MRANPGGLISALMIATLLGCSSASPSKAVEGVGSWGATAHMVTRRWSEHSIPSHFAKRTLHSISQQLQSQTEALKSMEAPADVRATAAGSAQRMQRDVAALDSAITRSNMPAVQSALADLDRQRAVLAALDSTLVRNEP